MINTDIWLHDLNYNASIIIFIKSQRHFWFSTAGLGNVQQQQQDILFSWAWNIKQGKKVITFT